MEQRAVAGFRWTLATYAVGKVITLASTVVLARLLSPADFGVVMLAFVAINVVGLFGDLGLGATLVVRQDLDRRGTGTVLTLLIGTGALLGSLLVIAAPFLGDVFDERRLGGVLVALAPLTVLGSVNWFYQWLLQRDLEFRTRFLGHLVQALVYGTVAVGAAALGAGEWSIVAGHLFGTLAMTVIFLSCARTRVRPAFDRAILRSLFTTSRGFLLQSTTTLLQQNADYIAVGRTLGSSPLGLYSMAFRLSELPHLAVADPVARVTFPGFTRMRLRGEDVSDLYLRSLRMVAIFTGPVGILLSAVVAPFTLVVYGSRWLPMTGALSVLAVWGVVKSVQVTVEAALNSAGGADEVGVTALVMLGLQVPALFIAAATGGLVAVSWVILGATCLSALVLVVRMGRRLGLGFAAHRRALGPVIVACVGAWLAARGVSHVPRDASPYAVLVAGVAAGLVAYLAILAALAPGSVRGSVDQIRGTVRDEPAVTGDPVRTAVPGPDGAAPGAEAPATRGGTGASGEAHRGANPESS